MYVLPGVGYMISLYDKDREMLDNGEDLSTFVDGMKFVFRVRDHAEPDSNQMKFDWYHSPNFIPKQYLTEPGFWVEVFPPNWENVGGKPMRNLGEFDNWVVEEPEIEEHSERYLMILTIDRERWGRLCEQGAIFTRSLYDRFDIALHAEGVPWNS